MSPVVSIIDISWLSSRNNQVHKVFIIYRDIDKTKLLMVLIHSRDASRLFCHWISNHVYCVIPFHKRSSLKLFATRKGGGPSPKRLLWSHRRNVPPFKKRFVQTTTDAVATDFCSPCPSVHGDCIPERHDVTRRKEAAKRERLISPSSAARALLSEEPAL